MCVCMMRVCAYTLSLLMLGTVALANVNVTVIRQQLSYDEVHTLVVNASVEYILDFVPTDDQALWPSRVWMSTDGGDVAHPLLITARRRIGATTWELPYYSGDTILYQQERTLCPEDSVDVDGLREDCTQLQAAPLSLHVGAWCAAGSALRLRVARATDWTLTYDLPAPVLVQQGAPSVHFYQFEPDETSVRLVVESDDDVCATVAIQTYTCPIADTIDLIQTSTMRMTVLRSGGAHISREMYPRGFYVISLVRETDEPCREPSPPDSEDWLWEAAVLAAGNSARVVTTSTRVKRLTLHVKAALSRAQYLWGAGGALALLALFYVGAAAFVLAQRAPRWKRLVGPRAVLANKPEESTRSEVDSTLPTTPARRRRGSDATFDSSDNSDTDEEDAEEFVTSTNTNTVTVAPVNSTLTTTTDGSTNITNGGEARSRAEDDTTVPNNGIFVVDGNAQQSPERPGAEVAPRPFGLPARLHVAALARHRARVLSARSDRYLYTLCTVGLFYALPVVQFVAAFQLVLNVSGSLDTCYYNFLCAHPAGAISDFNHVFSNIGYLLLGALFMLQVRRRKMRRKRKPRHEEYGIPPHYGLLLSLGAAMMMVALLSATYHICPNGLNFQFDTSFMYVLAVLSNVSIYQARHADVNARAHATFGVLALVMLLVVWGVLGGGPLFWSIFTVLHVFTFLLLSLRIYYVGQFRFEKESLQEAARGLRSIVRPLYTARLVMLLIVNAVNWGFALYGLFTQSSDFAGHMLTVLLANTLMHMVFYLTMKLLHGERPRWYVWVHLAAAAASWAPALYFFQAGSSDWSTTPALSRHRNHECRVLHFYDSHDLWHLLSAVALYFSFNVMLTWDDGLAAVKRTEIAVF